MTSLVSAKKMAEILDLPTKSLYQYVKQYTIPHVRIGRHLRFEPPVVVEHLKGRKNVLSNTSAKASEIDFDALAKLVEPKRSLKTEKK